MAPSLKKIKKKKIESLEAQAVQDNFGDYDESQIFKIQIKELLKEMNVEEISGSGFQEWFLQLHEFMKNMEETGQHLVDDFQLNSVQLPIIKRKTSKEKFQFLPPKCVTTIGSFGLQTTSTKQPYVIDIAMEIPKACWQGMDFLNERYHRKRALYLATIAQFLQEAEFIEDLKFSYQNDCHLKPILLITPKGIKDQIISLTAYPDVDAFKVKRFMPSKNNVRSSWLLGKSDDDLEIPTPYYNSTILADLLLPKLNNYLKENITHENIRNGIKLVKLWLSQRGLLSGYGRLNGFIISMYIAYLLKKQKINCFMNPYQVLRCTLLALQHENFAEGISLADEQGDGPSFEEFKMFPGIFLDESGSLNLLYSLNKETLDMVKHEAKLGLVMLDNDVPNAFFHLFMRKISPLEKFEFLISLKGSKKFRKYSEKLCDEKDCLNFGANKIAAVMPKICDILRKGLNKRILLLDVSMNSFEPWSVSEKPPSPNCHEVTIGLLLDPDVPFSNIEKGPLADDPEARDFRQFWGDQSEMRRFQDGSIREAIFWPANTFEDKRKAFTQMLKDILKRHLGVQENSFTVVGTDVDVLLHIPKPLLTQDLLPYGTGEEAHLTVMNAFDSLSKQLRKLDGLPLQISSIQGISPAFHYTDVFPPLPITSTDSSALRNSDTKIVQKKLKSGDIKISPFIPALGVVIELESSGKWPNDVVGIRKLKTIFLLKIVELVKSQYSLFGVPFLDHADIVKDGFVFRLFIASHKELYLSKVHKLPNGMTKIQDTDESRQIDLTINILPRLNSLLHGLHLQHFSYGTACRLAKRWVSAQLNDSYIDSVTVELLVAHAYIHPEPLTCPSSPQAGFIRFLSLIVNHDWKISPLVVNLNGELQRKEIEEIFTAFTDQRSTLPPMVIVTPFDKRGTLWTKNKPSTLILKRLISLAKSSLDTLQNNLLKTKDFDVKSIFRPPLDFDVIIHLNHDVISKLLYAVDVQDVTELPTLKPFDKHKNKGYPVVEFDAPKLYFEQIKEIYDEFAHFFYDAYGGDFIGVIWKKSAFVPKELKTSHLNCHFLKDDSIAARTDSILEDLKLLGSGLVKLVTIRRNLL